MCRFRTHLNSDIWQQEYISPRASIANIRDNSHVGSGFGKNISNWLSRDKAYPSNVLHLATECGNKNHSATFPEGLPEWFIKLFTKEHDTVLDPFMGSGTTLVVANRMKRHSIGIDIVPEYCKMVKKEFEAVPLYLFERKKPKPLYAKTKPKKRYAVG
jgi:site-specific DNA-methyltransferase (adenine-specific)/site-specific DNA-methyltransferase (cytosine-N4-specific)